MARTSVVERSCQHTYHITFKVKKNAKALRDFINTLETMEVKSRINVTLVWF